MSENNSSVLAAVAGTIGMIGATAFLTVLAAGALGSGRKAEQQKNPSGGRSSGKGIGSKVTEYTGWVFSTPEREFWTLEDAQRWCDEHRLPRRIIRVFHEGEEVSYESVADT